MPVMVPEGLIVPFEKAHARIDHYRLNADLSPDLIDLEKVLKRMRSRRQLVVVVHYFGYAMPTVDATIITHAAGGLLLEDCAHCLVNPDPKNDCADLTLYSMNKILPVADGAMLMSRAPDVDVSLKPPEGELDRVTLNAYQNHLNANRCVRISGFGARYQQAKIQSGLYYEEYYRGISEDMRPRRPSRMAAAVREMLDFDSVVRERRKNAAVIVSKLRKRQLFREGLPIFAVPVRCRYNRVDSLEQLETAGISPSFLNPHWRTPPACYEHETNFWETHLLLPIDNDQTPDELNFVARMARRYI